MSKYLYVDILEPRFWNEVVTFELNAMMEADVLPAMTTIEVWRDKLEGSYCQAIIYECFLMGTDVVKGEHTFESFSKYIEEMTDEDRMKAYDWFRAKMVAIDAGKLDPESVFKGKVQDFIYMMNAGPAVEFKIGKGRKPEIDRSRNMPKRVHRTSRSKRRR